MFYSCLQSSHSRDGNVDRHVVRHITSQETRAVKKGEIDRSLQSYIRDIKRGLSPTMEVLAPTAAQALSNYIQQFEPCATKAKGWQDIDTALSFKLSRAFFYVSRNPCACTHTFDELELSFRRLQRLYAMRIPPCGAGMTAKAK